MQRTKNYVKIWIFWLNDLRKPKRLRKLCVLPSSSFETWFVPYLFQEVVY